MKPGEMVLGICLAMVTPAFASQNTSAWHQGERPVPHLMRLDGSPGQWHAYLAGAHLEPLPAIPGGRAYRWIHDGFSGQGYVELLVDDHGAGAIRSEQGLRTKFLRPQDTARFEDALEKTAFATMQEDDSSSGLDDCQDNVLEAVVDGRYHFVRRGCGLPEELVNPVKILVSLAQSDIPPGSPPDFAWTPAQMGEHK